MTPGTWEPRSKLYPDAIKEFELKNGVNDHIWPFRWPECDLPCSSDQVYKAKAHGRNDMTAETEQVYKGSLADKAVQEHAN